MASDTGERLQEAVVAKSPVEGDRAAARSGLLLGAAAVLCWSFGAALVYVGARDIGPWPFVALSSLIGAGLQLLSRWATHRELRSAFCLPWRLWAVPVLCFVLYGLVWPVALASSSPKQVFGVSLLNYLWPVLTVVFSVWWVPGVRMSSRLAFSVALACAGILLANLAAIREWLAGGHSAGSWQDVLPYALGLMAAVTWAVYSAVLVRWRDWAGQYVTSPLGFLLVGVVAGTVTAFGGARSMHLTVANVSWTCLYGAGPLAAGYLLWEIALPLAKVQRLSIVAAATPVLSTILLCCFLRTVPGWELSVAALLVSVGVVLSRKA